MDSTTGEESKKNVIQRAIIAHHYLRKSGRPRFAAPLEKQSCAPGRREAAGGSGRLFGLGAWPIGLYSLLGANEVALVVGTVAIAGSLTARDVHALRYCTLDTDYAPLGAAATCDFKSI